MDNAGYVALTRQSGLAREMQTVANNIANMSTTGYRREGVMFAEVVRALPSEGGSIAMTEARARYTDELQGALQETGGTFDLAIEGDGYFTLLTPRGERLTRAGAFTRDANGDIVNMDGHPLLDEGGSPINVPFEARTIGISADGTVSADGAPLGKVGLVAVADKTKLFREAGTLFRADAGTEPVENGRVVQGFLEQSNVNPITEMSRMIEVQRAYEYGQKLLDQEDERIRLSVRLLSGQK